MRLPNRALLMVLAVSLVGSPAGAQLSSSQVATPTQLQRGPFSLSIKDDVFDALAYPTVFLSQSNVTLALNGDAFGRVASPDLFLNAPLAVRLEEVAATGNGGQYPALSIGQHFGYRAKKAGSSVDGMRLVYCQPKARQLGFGPGLFPVDDGESGWTASATDDGGTPAFSAWVAELPTTEVISNYYAYATAAHDTRWLHGLLLRVDQDVDLTGTPLLLAIDSDGYDYGPSGPVAQTDYVGGHPGGLGHSISYVGTDAEQVYLLLEGELRTGDNLILLDNPVSVPTPNYLPLQGPVLYPTFASEGECPPPAPQCNTTGTCEPSCGGGQSTGGRSCHNVVILLDGVVCAPCGAEVSKEKCSEFKGGLVAKISWSLFGGDVSVTASGEIKGKVCSQVTALPGFCAQGYSCIRVCTRGCLYEAVHEGLIISNRYEASCKIDGITSATSCQHTDCSGD